MRRFFETGEPLCRHLRNSAPCPLTPLLLLNHSSCNILFMDSIPRSEQDPINSDSFELGAPLMFIAAEANPWFDYPTVALLIDFDTTRFEPGSSKWTSQAGIQLGLDTCLLLPPVNSALPPPSMSAIDEPLAYDHTMNPVDIIRTELFPSEKALRDLAAADTQKSKISRKAGVADMDERFEPEQVDDASRHACSFNGCLKEFRHKRDLERHLRRHYEKLSLASAGESAGLGPVSNLCGVCGKVLSRKDALSRHILTRHPGSEACQMLLAGTPRSTKKKPKHRRRVQQPDDGF
ncbi:hypothetical protein BKA62DRAFT_686144 [Auriculariales sp. MPI-PUGE-AT-0066]|nr:hypothetical protein BKA62DRAFT_686144 [Auriculariales sp. MPI-PUGE-AT-0066]